MMVQVFHKPFEPLNLPSIVSQLIDMIALLGIGGPADSKRQNRATVGSDVDMNKT